MMGEKQVDVGQNTLLKENYTFLVADREGQVSGEQEGFYNHDVRFLSRYFWKLPTGFQLLLAHSARANVYRFHYSRIIGPTQTLGIVRNFVLQPASLEDSLLFHNTDESPVALTIELQTASDFADLFEVRGLAPEKRRDVQVASSSNSISFSYKAKDGIESRVKISFDQEPTAIERKGNGIPGYDAKTHPVSVTEARAVFRFELAPGATWGVKVIIAVDNPIDEQHVLLPDYSVWNGKAQHIVGDSEHIEGQQRIVEQAVYDLRALMLSTAQGYLPAAGVPWYVAPFGRDALLTSCMVLDEIPELADGTLRYLAVYQGQRSEISTAEEPGKILHELRGGELARTGEIPHAAFYGTIDATPLYVILLHRTWRMTRNGNLVESLKQVWESALAWIEGFGDIDGDGFVEYPVSSERSKLVVQGWKDSEDSMSHADGSLASGSVAPSEVQGYVYAAYLAAADLYRFLGDSIASRKWQERAYDFKRKFQVHYWLEELGTYAMALDGEKRPLAVLNSNAGHLLWCGIVPEEHAAAVVDTLMSEDLWSGWGIRTLGSRERRYNPVSYHNGSVWPHDTAICAAGMARYGFRKEAKILSLALFDLAASQTDKRLPELVAGYERDDSPPIPYPVACRPQAWDAAATLFVLPLLKGIESSVL